ncbi:hypothetical protein ACJJTC_005198 [Scirpophaga incertulas]
MSDSDEDLIIISLLCAENERIMDVKKKKKKWIADIPRSRNQEGEYHYLFPRLLSDSARFHTYFRMSKTKFYKLLYWTKPHIQQQDTRFRKSIGAEERLMVTIRFLATGDSFKTIGESFRLGYSTVQEIIHTTCAVIWEVLSKLVMPEPNKEMWKKISEDFHNKWNYPNCLGALDGKHIKIQAPAKIGDEAFPLKTYLMRPYPGTQLDDESKKIYNYRHSRARRVSENAFVTCFNEHQPTEENIPTEAVWENLPRLGGNFVNNAFQVREKFKHYFTSNEGSVPWQRDRIRRGCRREEE